MKITIEPTGRFTSVEGVHCRVWKGKTEAGIECELFVPFVQVKREDDNAEFERALREVQVERELVSFDHRMVI